MLINLEINKKFWFITAISALVASLWGVINPEIYKNVADPNVIPGMIAQDLMTIAAGVILLLFSLLKTKNSKIQIIPLSLLGYLFYGYAIYGIEQIYNFWYFVYLVIMALSFWGLIYGLLSLNSKAVQSFQPARWLKFLTAGFSVFIPLLFYLLWIFQLIPLMQNGERIEYTFSIFILDMVFVLPAFLISAFLILKKNVLGYVFATMLFFKAFTLLFSVGLGALIKPIYNQAANTSEGFFYIILSLIFLGLAVLNYIKLNIADK